MSQSRLETASLTPLHWVAVVLAAVTGVIHLVLGVMFFPGGLPISFLLAGAGYVGAIALFLRNYRRRQLYLAGVGYTAIQIVLYLLINQRSDPAISPVEGIDKAAQILLIVVLVVLYRREE
jgi:4-amino-4-deoxy-L-arabinose transferase-like glycosyltransferase